MNARILTTTALAIALSSALPARAADPQLLGLVMPDAKVLAGVNVEQAKGTPFGQYVLNQVNANQKDLQELIAATGFDPTRDVREVLVASSGDPKSHTGILLGRGNFDVSHILAAAALKGVAPETYGGVNILTDPKKNSGIAFLSPTLVAAGDLASVKAVIDRQKQPAAIPAALAVQVNQWSLSQDAWVIATVPPSLLKTPAGAPPIPGLTGNTAFQTIQQAAAGIKFGNNVVFTAQAQADTAQNAEALANVVKLLMNLAQMQQTQPSAQALALVKALTVSTSGNLLNLSLSLPQDQFQQLLVSKPQVHPRRSNRPAGRTI
jgi:hypothetical protein